MKRAVSKRILLLSLCIAVLFVALGTYSYVEISSLKSQVDSLQGQVDMLQDEIDSIHNSTDPTNNTRNFVFEWPSWEQEKKVVNGTLRMNLTFTLEQGNLSIIARINDDEYNRDDGFGIVFDLSENGEIGTGDRGVRFYAENTTKGIIALDGGYFSTIIWPPQPSRVHTCVFESEGGYTFNISLPRSDLELYISSDLVRVAFGDVDCQGGAYITFHIGLSLEAP